MREHVDLDTGIGDILILQVLGGLEGVPGRCFLSEECPGCKPEDDGCDFKSKMRPVEIKLWEPQGVTSICYAVLGCGQDCGVVNAHISRIGWSKRR